jgi:hypothetical protein
MSSSRSVLVCKSKLFSMTRQIEITTQPRHAPTWRTPGSSAPPRPNAIRPEGLYRAQFDGFIANQDPEAAARKDKSLLASLTRVPCTGREAQVQIGSNAVVLGRLRGECRGALKSIHPQAR